MRTRLIFLSSLLTLLAPAMAARAQLGPALAGRTAQAENAMTVNMNPAGMTRIPSWQVAVDGMLAISDNRFVVGGDTSEDGGNPNNDVDVTPIPTMGVSIPLFDRFRLGFGLSVPTGIGTDYGDDWAGRYFVQESSLVFISAQPVVAARVTDWLSIGAGASIMYSASKTETAINHRVAPDGSFELDVDGVAVGPVLGLLVEPSDDLRFGFSWRGEIEPDLDGTPKFRNLSPALEIALKAAGIYGEKVELGLRIPQVIQTGFYWRPLPKLALMGDMTWIDWSRFGKVDFAIADTSVTLRTDYEDIWIGSIGAEYEIAEDWKAAIGFTYVSSAVKPKNRSLGLPLDEFFISGISLQHQLSDRVGLHFTFQSVVGGKGKVRQESARTGIVDGGIIEGKYDRRVTFTLQTSLVWGEPG